MRQQSDRYPPVPTAEDSREPFSVGIAVRRLREALGLSQARFYIDVLAKTQMKGIKNVFTGRNPQYCKQRIIEIEDAICLLTLAECQYPTLPNTKKLVKAMGMSLIILTVNMDNQTTKKISTIS